MGLGRGRRHLTISPLRAQVLAVPLTDTWWAAPGTLAFVSPPSSLPPSQELLRCHHSSGWQPGGWWAASQRLPSLVGSRPAQGAQVKGRGYCKDRHWSHMLGKRREPGTQAPALCPLCPQAQPPAHSSELMAGKGPGACEPKKHKWESEPGAPGGHPASACLWLGSPSLART